MCLRYALLGRPMQAMLLAHYSYDIAPHAHYYILSSFIRRSDVTYDSTDAPPPRPAELSVTASLIILSKSEFKSLLSPDASVKPKKTVWTGLSSMFLAFSYPFMKRVTWWPQLWLGINFNWGVLVGYYALTEVSLNFSILLFYSGCIFWTVAYDTIYVKHKVWATGCLHHRRKHNGFTTF